MATEAQPRRWLSAVEAALDESNGERYQLRQREMTRRRAPESRARPLEFDENGFPIPQPVSGFVQRVGRLINGT
jgi:hypothetical protein